MSDSTDTTLPKPKGRWHARGPRELKQTSIEFYSRLDVAKILGCSKAFVQLRLEKPNGPLTPYKFGPIIRYPGAEVRAMIEKARAAK